MTPILLIAFANLDRVDAWRSLAKNFSNPIWLVVDGGRNQDEQEICEDVVEQYCEIFGAKLEKVILREVNFGCGRGPYEAINWAFEHTDRLIILEDDCIPDPSFFPYCEEMLDRYENDDRVMTVSGSRFYEEPTPTDASYQFSKFQHIWGWATWKRAWEKMDYSMNSYAGKVDTKWLGSYLGSKRAGAYWRRNFQTVLDGRSDVWDYQWQLACWANQGLCIQPKENLISNIGVDTGGTHSDTSTHHRSTRLGTVQFPLVHPEVVAVDETLDQKIRDEFFSEGKLKDWAKYLLKG